MFVCAAINSLVAFLQNTNSNIQHLTMTKPIKLYSHASGPNPWKVVIIMEELGIPYESEMLDFSVVKKVS